MLMPLGAALALVATPVLAMTPQEDAALRQSCSGDYFRLCSNFDPGSPQVQECFRTHAKELSPACSSAIGAYVKSNPSVKRR